MTERQKRRYAHFAAMINTYPENSEWKTSGGVVEMCIKYYDYSRVPWRHRIQPERKKNMQMEHVVQGLLPIMEMEQLCRILTRPCAMALCMVLFQGGGYFDTLFMRI